MELTSAQLGERIRVLRKERGWTLQKLSHESGVSLSALSKIENAQVAPSFDTLVKVARGLGMGFDALLDQVSTAAEPARAGGRLAVTRNADTISFSTAMYDYEVHAGGLRRKFMTPLVMEVKARRVGASASFSSHDGEEFIYIIKGRIELHTEFYEPVTLEAGDSAYIDSTMGHLFLNVGRGRALMASICYSDAIGRPLLSAGGALEGVTALALPNGAADDEETGEIAMLRRRANRSP